MLESGPAAAALNVWQKKVTVSKRPPNASRNPHSTPALFTPPHERSLLSASIQCREMIFHFEKIRIKVYQAKCVVTLLLGKGERINTRAHADATHCGANHTVGLETAFSVLSRRRLFVLVPREWHYKSHVYTKPLFLSHFSLSFMNFCSVRFLVSLRACWAGSFFKSVQFSPTVAPLHLNTSFFIPLSSFPSLSGMNSCN